MSKTLLVLLQRQRQTLQRLLELEIADLDRQIQALHRPKTPRATAVPSKRRGPLSSTTEQITKETILAIREVGAGKPARRQDVAAKLGLDTSCVDQRLHRLKAMGFVERAGVGLYRVADTVPEV